MINGSKKRQHQRERVERRSQIFDGRIETCKGCGQTWDFVRMNVECSIWVALRFVAEKVKNSFKSSLVVLDCCINGRVQCAPPQNSLIYLLKYLTSFGLQTHNLRKNLWSYSKAMSMAPATANGIERGSGVSHHDPSTMIQERIYYSISAFIPPKGFSSTYPSVYIHDKNIAEQSKVQAQNRKSGWLETVVNAFDDMLRQHISYVQSFWHWPNARLNRMSLKSLQLWYTLGKDRQQKC